MLTLLGPRTEAWPEDCSAASKSNDLKTSALLYAHRCYLKVLKHFDMKHDSSLISVKIHPCLFIHVN